MPQAILFDLDETLVDRTRSITRYAERLNHDFSTCLAPISTPAIAAAILAEDGRGYRPREELFAALIRTLPWQTPPEIKVLQTHWQTCFPGSTVARAGLAGTLRALHMRGIRLGIVTNGAVRSQRLKIEELGIDPYLSTVVISEAAQVKKPDPRIFAQALAELGCPASQAWFVGDHPVNDVQGAAAAGLRPIWLLGVHPWPDAHPEPPWQIASLDELIELVDREHNSTT